MMRMTMSLRKAKNFGKINEKYYRLLLYPLMKFILLTRYVGAGGWQPEGCIIGYKVSSSLSSQLSWESITLRLSEVTLGIVAPLWRNAANTKMKRNSVFSSQTCDCFAENYWNQWNDCCFTDFSIVNFRHLIIFCSWITLTSISTVNLVKGIVWNILIRITTPMNI